jgi:cysteine synthase
MKLYSWALGLAVWGACCACASAETFYFNYTNLNRRVAVLLADSQQASLGGRKIKDVNVRLDLDSLSPESPMFNGDLYVSLTHGTNYAVLMNRVGRSATNSVGYWDAGVSVVFDDHAPNGDIHLYRQVADPAGKALTGAWAPDGRTADPALVQAESPRTALLSSFIGSTADGEWVLTVFDNENLTAITRLVSWGLEITIASTNEAPEIVTQPASLVRSAGGTAAFSVTAVGADPLSYQWSFNGLALPGATNYLLALNNLASAQAGAYQVVVTNQNGSATSQVATLAIQIPPSFSNPLVRQTNMAGTAATFSVEATGTPPLKYQWWFNGTLLAGATNASLALVNLQAAQAGGYGLVVSNLAGVYSNLVAVLTVWEPPAILQQPSDLVVAVGAPATFAAQGSSVLPISWQWYRNTSPLPGATSATLAIPSTRLEDAGQYSVTLSNLAGVATSRQASLAVYALPRITQQPANWSVQPGSNVVFRVVAESALPVAYQWHFQSLLVPGATNDTLVITNAQLKDAGEYWVSVTSAVGQVASGLGVLSLLAPPAITTQPASLVKTTGSNALFSVTAAGSEPLYYQWFFNSQAIPAANGISLSLTNVDPASAGSYWVVVTNLAGSATSQVATLAIQVPPAFSNPLIRQTNMAGTAVSFSVNATGTAPLAYQWWFNGAPLAGATNGSLALANLQAAQAGGYGLVVSNPAGVYSNLVAVLTVLGAPAITTQPASLVKTTGSNALFSVAATGSEPLYYQWFFNSQAIPAANGISLSLTNVDPASAGSYWVVVTNLAGSATSQVATLAIQVPPAFSNPLIRQTNMAGAAVSFSVNTTGTAPLAYQWWFNGAPLAGATNGSLALANLQAAQAGGYGLVVSNPAGVYSNLVAVLTVLGAPAITTQPASLVKTTGSTALFSVAATGSEPLHYQWFFKTQALPAAIGTSLSLANVDAASAGSYWVVVTNQGGSVTSSVATLTVMVQLTVQTPVNGTVEVNPPGPWYEAGTSVRLSATPANGSVFVKWSGDLQGSDARVDVTLVRNLAVNAIFGQVPALSWTPRTGLVLSGSAGNTYIVDFTDSLKGPVSWQAYATNRLATNTWGLSDPRTNGAARLFFRARLAE